MRNILQHIKYLFLFFSKVCKKKKNKFQEVVFLNRSEHKVRTSNTWLKY